MKRLLLSILLLFILTGCVPPSTTPAYNDPHVGSRGLTLEFLSTPKFISEEQPFFVDTQITNNGAADVKEAQVLLKLSQGAQIVTSSESPAIHTIELKGKTSYTQGESTVVPYDAKGVAARGVEKVDLVAYACYPYETAFSGTVCIDYDQTPESNCVTQTKTINGQGAPIVIHPVYAEVSGSRNVLRNTVTFTVLKPKNMQVFPQQDAENFCGIWQYDEESKAETAAGYIELVSVQLGDNYLNCKTNAPNNRNDLISLHEGDAKITCSGEDIPTGPLDSYAALLQIKLRYSIEATEKVSIPYESVDVADVPY